MKQIERRFLKQEVRVAGDDAPKITGYATVFDARANDMGYFHEEVDPHAFDNVMTQNPDVRALFNHDPNYVLGRTPNTLRLSIDARGLAYEIDPPDTQFARDLIVSMRRGDITQSSFAFIVARDQWTDNADGSITRRILEIEELFDVSPVTYPANPAASAQVRSLPDSMPIEMRTRIEKRDPEDGDGCDCGCLECEAGDCANCSDPDCNDPECRVMRSKTRQGESAESFRDRMSLRLRLLGSTQV